MYPGIYCIIVYSKFVIRGILDHGEFDRSRSKTEARIVYFSLRCEANTSWPDSPNVMVFDTRLGHRKSPVLAQINWFFDGLGLILF